MHSKKLFSIYGVLFLIFILNFLSVYDLRKIKALILIVFFGIIIVTEFTYILCKRQVS